MAQVDYNVWLDKGRFDDAERVYQEHLAQLRTGGCMGGAAKSSPSKPASSGAATPGKSPLACEIARAREHIQKSLSGGSCEASVNASSSSSGCCKFATLEKENRELKSIVEELRQTVIEMNSRLFQVEYQTGIRQRPEWSNCPPVLPPKEADKEPAADVDDDFELFGSDNEEPKEVDEEAERVRKERVDAYEAKKAKKPVLVAKSNIILDVKPWDDETDMSKLEECVRSIEMDGLLWGASKLVPLAYGIKKLQISCVVEDDKVSTEDLEEKLVAFEDYIQSMDIAAFNKI